MFSYECDCEFTTLCPDHYYSSDYSAYDLWTTVQSKPEPVEVLGLSDKECKQPIGNNHNVRPRLHEVHWQKAKLQMEAT